MSSETLQVKMPAIETVAQSYEHGEEEEEENAVKEEAPFDYEEAVEAPIPEEDPSPLKDDVYSLFFISPYFSKISIFALGIFFLKLLLYTLIALDLIGGKGSKGNPLNIPAGIPIIVRAAQFCMLPMSVAMQEDLIHSYALVNKQYTPELQKMHPGAATWLHWILAGTFRGLDGAYSLLINFVLLMQSESVIGLFLNFAALQFLQTVDNLIFYLAKEGYLTKSYEHAAKRVECTTMRKHKSNSVVDSAAFMITYFALVGVWIHLTIQQLRGAYTCDTLSVQFRNQELGDASVFASSDVLSGKYDRVNGKERLSGRIMYVQRESQTQDGLLGLFAYCSDQDVWSFFLTESTQDLSREDACENSILVSGDATSSYAITDASDWSYYLDGDMEPAGDFRYTCSN